MSKIDRCFLKIFSAFRSCQILCIFTMSILVFAQVLLRELFGIGVQWVYEFSCFMQVTMVWLGVPILLYKDSNIRITALYGVLPAAIKRVLDILRYGVCLSCAGFMAYGYVLYVNNLGMMKSSVMRLPNYLFFGAMALGIAMTLLVVVLKAKKLLRLDGAPQENPAAKEVTP